MIPPEAFQHTLLELLAPIRSLLDDPTVSEILINGPEQVFSEQAGVLRRTELRFASRESLLAALRCAAQFADQTLDAARPLLVARLPDGSRLHAAIAPAAPLGPLVTIRRPAAARRTLAELVAAGALAESVAAELATAVRAGRNLLVVGPAGSGKTSFLAALLDEAAPDERIVVVEDGRELDLGTRHVIYLETSASDPAGRSGPTLRDLVRVATRLRPDRLVVGDLEGDAALDCVRALGARAVSCLFSLQAAHPQEALCRLEALCLTSQPAYPADLVRRQIASGLDCIVALEGGPRGARRVGSVSALAELDPGEPRYSLVPAASGPEHGTNVQNPKRTHERRGAVVPGALPAESLDKAGPKARLPLPFPRTRS